VIPTAPLRVRNRLAEIILAALEEPDARRALTAVTETDAPPPDWLEPAWREAEGGEREALQGLIQIAVGYQHLANGNLAGARALLDEGARRLRGHTLDALDLDAFDRAVGRTVEQIFRLDWQTVPAFPRPNVRKETS